MKKKILSLLAITLLLALLISNAACGQGGPTAASTSVPDGLSAVNTSAQGGLTVIHSSVQVLFPNSIAFNISAQSGADITDIRLHYTVDRMDFAKIVSEVLVNFTPAKSVTQQYSLDMRKTGGFPPGTELNYWWTLTDAAGDTLETTPQMAQVQDGRYAWQTLKEGMVTLYWYKGDSSFASGLMDATQQALGRLSDNTGAELKNPVYIYIYASAADLQGAMIFPQEWTGGVAFTQYGIIAIGIATDASSIAWGKGAIAHELTHLVVYQVTSNPYNSLPTWLDEGLAMYSEGALDSSFSNALYTAQKNNALISVRSLTSPFSAYADQSILAYGESYTIVAYLIQHYGRDSMLEMLNIFGQGSGYDDALKQVYGFDMDGLNALWQASLISLSVS